MSAMEQKYKPDPGWVLKGQRPQHMEDGPMADTGTRPPIGNTFTSSKLPNGSKPYDGTKPLRLQKRINDMELLIGERGLTGGPLKRDASGSLLLFTSQRPNCQMKRDDSSNVMLNLQAMDQTACNTYNIGLRHSPPLPFTSCSTGQLQRIVDLPLKQENKAAHGGVRDQIQRTAITERRLFGASRSNPFLMGGATSMDQSVCAQINVGMVPSPPLPFSSCVRGRVHNTLEPGLQKFVDIPVNHKRNHHPDTKCQLGMVPSPPLPFNAKVRNDVAHFQRQGEKSQRQHPDRAKEMVAAMSFTDQFSRLAAQAAPGNGKASNGAMVVSCRLADSIAVGRARDRMLQQQQSKSENNYN